MTLAIGVDFDNTIVSYDALMHRAALDRGLITDGPDRTKRAVRDRIRRLPDGEIEWQKLQALAYGPRMREAQPVDGADAFLRRCRRAGIRVFIVSHKTEYAGYDDTRTNLRTAALEWMTAHRFFERDGLDLVPGDVYFESTRGAKIARIGSIGCSYFIDDLEEVFLEPSFPPQVQKILYAPDMALVCTHCATVMPTWQALGDYLFDRSPDLRGICRAALGRDVVSSAPIGAGRNSRVFRVELAGARPPSPLEVVVKFYRRDAGDARDRLGTEFGSLQFLWRNGVRAVPRPMAIDPDRQCAIYESHRRRGGDIRCDWCGRHRHLGRLSRRIETVARCAGQRDARRRVGSVFFARGRGDERRAAARTSASARPRRRRCRAAARMDRRDVRAVHGGGDRVVSPWRRQIGHRRRSGDPSGGSDAEPVGLRISQRHPPA